MTEILNNPWVTGIGGGIISSLTVFFVTQYMFSRKENKEYNQKIETAKNEMLYSIRPLIIEKKIPSNEIFQAIRVATAKKYGVSPSDLFSEYSISNDLINEIMSNSFLSSEQKIELSELLSTIKRPKTQVIEEKNMEVVYLNERDGLSSKYNSILLATISFATVIAMTFSISYNGLEIESEGIFKDNFTILLIATTIPIASIIILLLLRMIREKEKFRELHKNEKSDYRKDDEE